MAYNEKLTNRIRTAFADVPKVKEKKMCISVGDDEILCRVDPALHDEALQRKGSRTMEMKGREYKGFIYVNEEGIKSKKDFDYWIGPFS